MSEMIALLNSYPIFLEEVQLYEFSDVLHLSYQCVSLRKKWDGSVGHVLSRLGSAAELLIDASTREQEACNCWELGDQVLVHIEWLHVGIVSAKKLQSAEVALQEGGVGRLSDVAWDLDNVLDTYHTFEDTRITLEEAAQVDGTLAQDAAWEKVRKVLQDGIESVHFLQHVLYSMAKTKALKANMDVSTAEQRSSVDSWTSVLVPTELTSAGRYLGRYQVESKPYTLLSIVAWGKLYEDGVVSFPPRIVREYLAVEQEHRFYETSNGTAPESVYALALTLSKELSGTTRAEDAVKTAWALQ